MKNVEMEKVYSPREIEDRLYAEWEENLEERERQLKEKERQTESDQNGKD